MAETFAVGGHAAPGYERVLEVLQRSISEVGSGGIAFSARRGEQELVDIWAGQADPQHPWGGDTISAYFSATKGMTALCAMVLYDRGLLDLDAPIAQYWPDFQAPVSVRQVLSHTSGITEIPGYLDFMDLAGKGWDEHAEIRKRLATATPSWEPGSAVGYHGMTYGYLVGTLVELISGKRMSDFFDEEIGVPFGLELWFGPPPAQVSRMTTLLEPDPVPTEYAAIFDALLGPTRDEHHIAGRAFIAREGEGVLDHLATLGSSVTALRCGGGFGDGVGTARALAELYAHILGGLPSTAAVATFSEVQARGTDQILGLPTAFCLGFQGNIDLPTGGRSFGPGARTFGHGGAGGQLGIADPDTDLSFGFVRSHLSLTSPLARNLIAAVYDAAGLD